MRPETPHPHQPSPAQPRIWEGSKCWEGQEEGRQKHRQDEERGQAGRGGGGRQRREAAQVQGWAGGRWKAAPLQTDRDVEEREHSSSAAGQTPVLTVMTLPSPPSPVSRVTEGTGSGWLSWLAAKAVTAPLPKHALRAAHGSALC